LPVRCRRRVAGNPPASLTCRGEARSRIRRISDYTITNLDQVEDSATKRGLEFGSARFPREDVGAERTGFAHIALLPGRQQTFGHRHKDAEEVYFVISGSGAIKLDDGVHELRAHDIVRLAPAVTRSLRAGPDGMEVLAFGARHAGDGELVDGYWET
jgi:mannose-6-phosphate isomerase-like protein (cupin superfamily)